MSATTAPPAPPRNAPPLDGGWRLEASYARLPAVLWAAQPPVAVSRPRLVVLNRPLAAELGLDADWLESSEGVETLAGNRLPPGATPLAQAYAGHQFGHPAMLGDGRAVLLGEQRTPNGRLVDIQLKGSGRTPFSRSGDGRAALGPMLREYLVSEAMAALGVPTTRSLAVVATGEPVFRDTVLPGALLVRVAASHVRVGTMQYAAVAKGGEALPALVDHVRARLWPQACDALELLEAVVAAQARLIAQWMVLGFVHGVMNTDNMALSGETIDYGPCAFMEAHDPATVFSSIDRAGRYAYGQQPRIAHWNLVRLAEALLPLIGDEREAAVARAEAVLARFPALHAEALFDATARRLGLDARQHDDARLVDEFWGWMREARPDHTASFRALATGAMLPDGAGLRPDVEAWIARWQARLEREEGGLEAARQRMAQRNPAVIPRNHKVDEALAASEAGELGLFEAALGAVTRPFDEPADREWLAPAPPGRAIKATFCGT